MKHQKVVLDDIDASAKVAENSVRKFADLIKRYCKLSTSQHKSMISMRHDDGPDGEYRDVSYVFYENGEIVLEVINMVACPSVGEFMMIRDDVYEVETIFIAPIDCVVIHHIVKIPNLCNPL